ncbi:hypothetical protein SmaMPs15_000046 [Stenotrophomonas maltophilia phage vB_SmaM_Ps15]|uniref:Uncharacterized protein n=1 Tax=Stenotrophomonas maltophilia phage vB_SmaM_Ps15 TaxID=3071007 RepID=A0AAE9FL52_9CAUD|nr:hypothetical protein PQC01_gp046 [Stenotrophomonas maltophilia phage vB_SmaM_Ps15]UMO77197.1 hypothetical protein SmaMPs15_000046 [Stenotrophomonas maltophilia phage vB_SmaM_Ps15]
MNVYKADYWKDWGWGAYDEESAIIIANTASEALGFALQEFPDSIAEYWEIEQIDTSKPGIA